MTSRDVGLLNPFATGGAYTGVLFANSTAFFYQSTKPTARPNGSALVSGDFWTDTSTNLRWTYNGTYWLSENIFVLSSAVQNYAYSTGINLCIMPAQQSGTAYDLYFHDLCAATYVTPVNNGNSGGHSWLISGGLFSGIGNLSSLNGTYINTAGNATNQWITQKATVNWKYTEIGTNSQLGFWGYAAGSPGNLFAQMNLTYSWVAP